MDFILKSPGFHVKKEYLIFLGDMETDPTENKIRSTVCLLNIGISEMIFRRFFFLIINKNTGNLV